MNEGRTEIRIAAVVLAAGRSTRMEGPNKLVTPFRGKPLVRHAVEAALDAATDPTLIVTGHDADAVRNALFGMPVRFVANPNFADGLATSVAAGVAALPSSVRGAFMILGDMPRVKADHLCRLMDAFAADPADDAICVPIFAGRRGNPVLWGRGHFIAMRALSGDVGARSLIAANSGSVREVPMGDDGVLFDVDTMDDLSKATR